MSCLSANALVELAGGRLASDERDAALAHLERCDSCRRLAAAAADDDALPEDDTPGRGESVGRYLVLEPIGAGAMGVVLAAYDPELDRRVALKLLRADLAARGDAGGHDRLQAEARALARLSHPNVVAVHDVGRFGDEVFIAMELVGGQTLAAWLRERPRRWPEILAVLCDAGEGLAAAHAAGIVHRDVKPDNVLVPGDGRVRITDFGLARATAATILGDAPLGRADVTRTGALTGTPMYMAPELFAGAKADESTDVFAFCVTAFEALFGCRPFAAESIAALSRVIAAGEPAATPSSGVPATIRAIVVRGLRADRAARWPTMRSLLDALHRARRRSRRLVGFVAAGTGATALLLAGALGWAREPACSAGAAAIASTWDDAVRERVQAAFVDARPEQANAAFTVVDDRLTAWAERWAQGHDDACAATTIRGVQSEALLDARASCLERARGEVAAIVRIFEQADAAVVEHAAGVVEQVPDVGLCANLEAMERARANLPVDPEARAEHDALERRIAEIAARASIDLPTRDDYVAVIDAALARGFVALAARAGARLGRAAPNPEESRRFFGDAAARALTVGDDDALARSWLGLAETAGRETRLREAELASQQADAAITRLGDPAELRALWHHKNCIIHTNAGLLEEAAASCSRAVEATAAVGDGPQLADAELSVGVVAYWRGEPELALTSMRAAAERYRRLVGDGHSLVDNAEANIAEVLIVLGRTDEALAVLREILVRRPESIPLRDGIATALRHAGDPAAALAEDQALLALCEPTASCPFWALLGMGEDLLALGRTDEATRWFERARALDADMPAFDRARLLLGLADAIAATDAPRARTLATEAEAVIEPWARQYGSRYAPLLERARRRIIPPN